MAKGLTAQRVRSDVDVVARAGLDLESFLAEALSSISRAVPWVSACVATHDPGTLMMTTARKFGHLREQDDTHDHEFGLIEYGAPEATSFMTLARAEVPVGGVHQLTDGDVASSRRMAEFHNHFFGYHDEMRVAFREGGEVWGAMGLFRGWDERPFDEAEAAFLASLSAPLARGVRTGVLVRLAQAGEDLGQDQHDDALSGPAVVIVGPDDVVTQMTPAAERRIAQLAASESHAVPSVVAGLVAAARRYAAGDHPAPARCRIRTAGGMWLVLQAGPLSAFNGRAGDVVVTIEEARPPEIVSLVVAAFGLTPRERDVTQMVLQGCDTKEIARTLHLSTYTVQDHLKAVFEKADVRSRRELIAKIYFDQYAPRRNHELGASGWFA